MNRQDQAVSPAQSIAPLDRNHPDWVDGYDVRAGGRLRHERASHNVQGIAAGAVLRNVAVALQQDADADGGNPGEPRVIVAGVVLDVQQARAFARVLTELCDVAAPHAHCPVPAEDAPEHFLSLDASGPLTEGERALYASATPVGGLVRRADTCLTVRVRGRWGYGEPSCSGVDVARW